MNIMNRHERKEREVLDEDKQLSYFYSLLEMVSSESLLRCMNKLVELEDYEIAVLYRDELIRRGKLKPELNVIPGPR